MEGVIKCDSPESVLGPVLLNIFIHDLEDRVECRIRESADDTELGEVADALKSRFKNQDDHDKLEKMSKIRTVESKKSRTGKDL